ncbi:MAG: hypothetical protein U1F52_18490 [Burkholderiales bacterium]
MLRHRNPRFVCRAAGGPDLRDREHTSVIDHEVTPALDAGALADLRSQWGDLPALIGFYERFGSLRLYRDSVTRHDIGRASAYYIASPDTWAGLHESVVDWLGDIDEEERAEFVPDWLDGCIAIGQIPNSGNTFLVPVTGTDRGKVFEFEHDGLEFIERADTFEAFVEQLATVDEARLRDIGSHTRSSDGQTPLQWMPVSYLHD